MRNHKHQMKRMVFGLTLMLVALALCCTGVGIPLVMILVGIGWDLGGFRDA